MGFGRYGRFSRRRSTLDQQQEPCKPVVQFAQQLGWEDAFRNAAKPPAITGPPPVPPGQAPTTKTTETTNDPSVTLGPEPTSQSGPTTKTTVTTKAVSRRQPATSRARATMAQLAAGMRSVDPDVAWRVEAMRRQVPATGPLPVLVARDIPPAEGACLSCGEQLGPDSPYRCRACTSAASIVIFALQLKEEEE